MNAMLGVFRSPPLPIADKIENSKEGALRLKVASWLISASSLGVLIGCSHVKVSKAPGSVSLLTCPSGIKSCLGRADQICGDEGYTILSGRSERRMLGGANSPYQVRAERAELEIRCGVEDESERHDVVFRLPKRKDRPLSEGGNEQPDVRPAPAEPSPPRACVPGSTQQCTGPGACAGGQSCAADGARFGPCDCGNESSAPVPDGSDNQAPPSAQDPVVGEGTPSARELPSLTPEPTPLSKPAASPEPAAPPESAADSR